MYNIYTTEGITIKIRESGETDKILSVFTKDFGRIEIFVKGARNIKSKLNPHLDLFNYSRISFISGREFFRLTDAYKIYSFPKENNDLLKIQTISRIFYILEKMIHSQEKNEKIWFLLLNMLKSFNLLIDKISKTTFQTLESIFLFKIMHILGYIDVSSDIFSELVKISDFDEKTIKKYEDLTKEIFKIVNFGIKASDMI